MSPQANAQMKPVDKDLLDRQITLTNSVLACMKRAWYKSRETNRFRLGQTVLNFKLL